ncbi:MAG: hypothetical protein KDA24_03670 [Deltaproteobacteria bacterium]|nr:hypothetical protein [Deltaproteobacteria bacterium]
MNRLALLACAALLTACPEGDTPSPTDDDDATEDPCANSAGLLSVEPEQDAEDLYTDTVSATWDAVPLTPTLVVTDANGDEIGGAIEEADNGRTLIFTATEVFAASSVVTATAATECMEAASWSFSSGPYGGNLDAPEDLIDRVFDIDLGSADIVEPAGIGGLLQGFIADVYVLFQMMDVSDFTAGELHVMGALGELGADGVEQDMCTESLPLTFGQDGELGTADDVLATWEDPYLRVGPTDLTLEVEGTEATIEDLFLEMLFHPQATSFVAGRLEGMIDTRPLVGLLDSEDPSAICELAEETVGISCIDCGGGEEFCLRIVAENIQGEMLSDTGLATVTEEDIDNNADCD